MAAESLTAVATRWRGSPLRVFLLFGIGIVIPAAFLSFLGFRSYQYENQLMRKQMEERHQALADVVQRRAEEVLQAPAHALADWAARTDFARADKRTRVYKLLDLKTLGEIPIDELFVVDLRNQPSFPPMPAADDRTSSSKTELSWGSYADEIDRLERLEFVDKKPGDALKGYMALNQKPMSLEQKAGLWMAMAAAARKSGDSSFAIACYQKLIQDFAALRATTGEPYGVLARRLLITLYENLGFREKAVEKRLELAEGVLLGEWLGPYLSDSLWAVDTADKELKARISKLKESRQQIEKARLGAARFWREDWRDALKRLRSRGWMDQGGIIVLNPLAGRSRWLIAVPAAPSSGEREGMLLAIVDPKPLLGQAEAAITELVHPAGLEGALNPVGHGGAKSPWTTAVVRMLNSIDPIGRLEMWEPPSSTANPFERRRLWIYGGMVGLSFLVILAGIILMGYSMRREMELSPLKADFVATVSHELRTPLASISYISGRLNRGRYRSPEEAQEFYGMLGEEARRLQELIEDVLDFSRMLGGKKTYDLKPQDLRVLVTEALDRLQGKIQTAGFQINTTLPQDPVPVQADRRSFVQAIGNLIDNAIKYSGDSKTIEVDVARLNDCVEFRVKDHGIGVPPSEQGRIFEKFYRVEHAGSRSVQKGVGLGLAMVKQIIDGHRGTIEVLSRPGEGSCFSVRLPLHPSQETPT